MNHLLTGIALYTVGQILIWIQSNGQFLNKFFYDNPMLISLFGVPVSYLMIVGTRHCVAAFDGMVWAPRLLQFGIGIVVFSILTYLLLGQGLTTKTVISLLLAIGLIFYQIFG